MRWLVVGLTLAILACSISAAGAKIRRVPARCSSVPAWRLCGIHSHVQHANQSRLHMGQHRLRYLWRAEQTTNLRRRNRFLSYWTLVDRRTQERFSRWQAADDPATLIRRIFGAASAGQALAVAQCESGLSPTATNGQYHGLYQLSASWRGYFGIGEGYDARLNITAAHAIYLTHGWAPWSCRP